MLRLVVNLHETPKKVIKIEEKTICDYIRECCLKYLNDLCPGASKSGLPRLIEDRYNPIPPIQVKYFILKDEGEGDWMQIGMIRPRRV